MKHYGQFLPFAGNPIKYLSNELELMHIRKERLQKELNDLLAIINGKEKEFEEIIMQDWDSEEIEQAKLKANN